MTGSRLRKPRPEGRGPADKAEGTVTLPGSPDVGRGGVPSDRQGLNGMIPSVILPDGYSGKILLVLISVGKESLVVLRSGDLWHREILRNTRAEVRRLGLMEAQVDELGGASLFFDAEGSIRICGGSDEFGACDPDYAAALLRTARPGCTVVVASGEMA